MRRVLPAVIVGAFALAGSSPPALGRALPGKNSGARQCPVTLPNGVNPPGWTEPYGYRHEGLWVTLWPYGVTFVGKTDVRSDGWLAIKVPWYRFVRGRLHISGSRLDKKSPKLRADVPTGYGVRGFQASAVYVPTEGCWKIIGAVGHARLAFVTLVLKTQTVHMEVPRG
jgi:hypothetical protein